MSTMLVKYMKEDGTDGEAEILFMVPHPHTLYMLAKCVDGTILTINPHFFRGVFPKSEAKEVIIDAFIEESKKFGFVISKDGDKYICEAKCNHCGKLFTKEVKIDIIDGKVGCDLDVYCTKCKEGR